MDQIPRPWSALERAAVEARLGAAIVGSNQTVQAGFERLLERTGADEIIVVTDLFAHADRLESYERVAEVSKSLTGVAA
jgi:alkanesulfonate monooxygenase SsuD/methylene tetrahydromethanopterin reductase-like flavin-dependent oxidoreductase (luciferase family)